jgi:D-alanyl-lipoteichoic acid acyltransferase DltB (MBOAT superfamily)
MELASLQFVAFGLTTALISNLNRSWIWRSVVLMVATFIFLAIQAPHPLLFLPLSGFLLLGYVGILMLRAGWSQSQTWSLIAVLLLYCWLKKYTFLPSALFLQHPYFTLGLSYIMFRVLQLLIEAGEESKSRQISFGAYLLYTLNFSTFASGPLQCYDDFARDQFTSTPLPLGPRIIGSQLERIIRGFFKVNVLGMLLHAVQVDAINRLRLPLPASGKMLAVFTVSVTFPFFLYANFSGYIDIVVALARLMRLKLPENFNRPFSATSFLDFWNRWHITLSTWLKTFVYNPLLLALMRRISSRTVERFLGVFAFFITFFLVGIWHGRTSEFAVFGLLQGGGVAINKLWQVLLIQKLTRKRYQKLAANPIYDAFGRGLTFTWFAFTLFWFWGSWSQIHLVLGSLSFVETTAVWLSLWFIATLVLASWERIRVQLLAISAAGEPALTHRYAMAVYASVLGLISLAVITLNQPAPDIVYKAF